MHDSNSESKTNFVQIQDHNILSNIFKSTETSNVAQIIVSSACQWIASKPPAFVTNRIIFNQINHHPGDGYYFSKLSYKYILSIEFESKRKKFSKDNVTRVEVVNCGNQLDYKQFPL